MNSIFLHTKALVLLTGAFLFTSVYCWGQKKIKGVNLVAPPKATTVKDLATVKRVSADWVSLIPYAFMKPGQTFVKFDGSYQWWGETSKGTAALIEQAKSLGLKTMLKPHVWVAQQGWGGDFILNDENDWLAWENNYTNYILTYAKLAEKHHVELLCIGTELRQVVKNRPLFWKRLIPKIRNIYNGKITYAANWDNFENVDFWDQLDFIGIDGYFPLSENKTQSLDDLLYKWQPWKKQLNEFSKCHSKSILFTEYGYQSCSFNTKTPWNSTSKEFSENCQNIAYQAFYDTIWKEEWCAGGFLWKWHLTAHHSANRKTAFTPQGKVTEATVMKVYQKD